MSAAFLLVHDRFVGFSVTLEEAINIAAPAPEVKMDERALGLFVAWRGSAWLSLQANLRTGSLHSFLHYPENGAFVRIPREFWIKEDRQRPPSGMASMPTAHGYDPLMEGSPIVMWRDDVVAWAGRIQSMVDAMHGRVLSDDIDRPRPPAKGRPRKADKVRRIFRARLERGVVHRQRANEIQSIMKEWTEPSPPAPETVVAAIKPVFDSASWDEQGRLSNLKDLLSMLDRDETIHE